MKPPSARQARAWTIGALINWFLVPLAVIYQNKAREEARASDGLYHWHNRLWNRPVLLTIAVWGSFFLLLFVLTGILAHFGIAPV